MNAWTIFFEQRRNLDDSSRNKGLCETNIKVVLGGLNSPFASGVDHGDKAEGDGEPLFGLSGIQSAVSDQAKPLEDPQHYHRRCRLIIVLVSTNTSNIPRNGWYPSEGMAVVMVHVFVSIQPWCHQKNSPNTHTQYAKNTKRRKNM